MRLTIILLLTWFASSCGSSNGDPGDQEDGSVPATCERGGELVPLGQLCVRGRNGIAGESILPDTPIEIEATPAGCFSSGCVEVFDRVCGVTRSGDEFSLDSLFCLAPNGADACLPDCSGAGIASCQTEALAAGTYTITAGDLRLTFEVPSEIPFGGLCDGDPLSR